MMNVSIHWRMDNPRLARRLWLADADATESRAWWQGCSPSSQKQPRPAFLEAGIALMGGEIMMPRQASKVVSTESVIIRLITWWRGSSLTMLPPPHVQTAELAAHV
jgi:hypothetical protein